MSRIALCGTKFRREEMKIWTFFNHCYGNVLNVIGIYVDFHFKETDYGKEMIENEEQGKVV